MLMPKRVKYRKMQRGRIKGFASRGTEVVFGEYGLQALQPAWVTDRQIEAARITLTRLLKQGGKIWFRIFPDKPYTKRAPESRMGKGKGDPDHWVAVVKPGRILLELEGLNLTEAKEALRLVGNKFPIRTKFATRAVI